MKAIDMVPKLVKHGGMVGPDREVWDLSVESHVG